MTERSRTNPVPATPGEEIPEFLPFLTGPDLPDELIERLCNALCPPILATANMPELVRLIGASHSLSALDKLRIYNEFPTLSQFQIDKLTEVLTSELNQFAKLVSSEWQSIASLSAKTWLELCMVADHLGAGYPDYVTERKALTRMLKRKFCGRGRMHWVSRALGLSPLGDHVFSAIAGAASRSTGRAQLPEVF